MSLKKLIRLMPKFESWNMLKRNSGKYYHLIENIRCLLNILSGGNIIKMLKDVLTSVEIQLIAKQYVEALKKIGNENNKFNPLIKRIILRQLRNSGISFNQANNLDFKCTKFLWKKCKEIDFKKRGKCSFSFYH